MGWKEKDVPAPRGRQNPPVLPRLVSTASSAWGSRPVPCKSSSINHPPGTTAAGTLSPVLVSRCAQAFPGAIPKTGRKHLLSDRSGWPGGLGVLVGAHLGHTSQLGSGAGRGHCSITVPGGSSRGQFVLPRCPPQGCFSQGPEKSFVQFSLKYFQ